MKKDEKNISEKAVIKEQMKQEYIPIKIEIIDVAVEKGYAGSLSDRDNENW